LNGGLSKVAKELNVQRIGTMHQAGSDSIVTSGVFFSMKKILVSQNYVSEPHEVEMFFNRVLYGLGNSTNEDVYIEDYKAIVASNSANTTNSGSSS